MVQEAKGLGLTKEAGTGEKRQPWEKDPDGWKGANSDPGLTEEGGPEPKAIYAQRIVLLVAAPLIARTLKSKDVPITPLSVQEELIAIKGAFDSRIKAEFEIATVVATRQNFLRMVTGERPPLIIHFAGHGTLEEEETALILEDEVGIASRLTRNDLVAILNATRRPPCRLAVLNACHSEA